MELVRRLEESLSPACPAVVFSVVLSRLIAAFQHGNLAVGPKLCLCDTHADPLFQLSASSLSANLAMAHPSPSAKRSSPSPSNTTVHHLPKRLHKTIQQASLLTSCGSPPARSVALALEALEAIQETFVPVNPTTGSKRCSCRFALRECCRRRRKIARYLNCAGGYPCAALLAP